MSRVLFALTWIGLAAAPAPGMLPARHADGAAIVVHGPTVVACFVPVSDVEMEKDPDLNEALADFQLYTSRVRQPLQQRGIAFRVLSVHSFRMQIDAKVVSYRVAGAAYYFVAPGKTPRVVTGVMTDTDLLAAADRYFSSARH